MKEHAKRLLPLLLALCLLLTAAVLYSSATEIVRSGYCGDSLTWTLDSEGLLTISGTGAMTSHPWDRTKIKQVVIKSGVTSIGDYAFYGSTGLTSVTIPNSVTSIGDKVFYNCNAIDTLTIGKLIENKSLYDLGIKTRELKTVKISDGVTSIGNSAFYGCTGLTSVTIPDSVTSIREAAFSGCTVLTSLTVDTKNTVYHSEGNCIVDTESKTLIVGCMTSEIPSDGSVTSIGGSAFRGCTGLTSVTIPNSVTCIRSEAFRDCGLTSLTIPNSVTSIGDYAFYSCARLASVMIPNGVTSIGKSVFSCCTELNEVTIPNSVTSIGETAFYNCVGLRSITIPTSVMSIGSGAFSLCKGLEYVTIPSSVTSIGNSAFSGCTVLTSLAVDTNNTVYHSEENCIIDTESKTLVAGCMTSEIPSDGSVTSIGVCAFDTCEGLTSMTIPNSVTSIGGYAFFDCRGLTSVTIPASVTGIGSSAFHNCKPSRVYYTGTKEQWAKIKNDVGITPNYYDCLFENGIVFNKAKTTIQTVYDNTITSVTLPNSVTSIGNSAFSGCVALTSVTLPNSVTSIGNSAFSGCVALTSVTLPNSVTSIGNSAFSGCVALMSVTLPNNVMSIGNSAFSDCTELTSVTLPNSVTSIGTYAFYNCRRLPSVTIPNGVMRIENSVFSECKSLTSVTIGDSVTSIGDNAFYECTGLTSVIIGNSVTDIGNNAFYGCDAIQTLKIGKLIEKKSLDDIGIEKQELKTVEISDGVTSIGDKMFSYCSGLTSVKIPNSVTGIGNLAFFCCRRLTSVTIPDNVTRIGDSAFSDCTGLTSVTISDSVTSIGNYAFYGCKGLTRVSISDMKSWCGISFFGSYSNPLDYAHHLYLNGIEVTDMTIPDSVTSIGDWVFYNCGGLTSVTIPDSVTSIGEYAFTGCSGLKDVYFKGNKSDWRKIAIESHNAPLTSANIHYYDSTVTYNANGGTGTPAEQTKTQGEALTLSDVKPEKSFELTYNANGGSVSVSSKQVSVPFKNWNTKQDGSGTSYAPGGAYTADEEATLYAQWTTPKAGELAVPTREGYTFVGWFTAVSGGKQVNKDTEIKADTILYAVWAAFLPGDVSGDGEVTAEDARLALRAAVGLETYAAGSTQFLAADATKDGAITAEDARLILRAAVGLETLA